MSDEEQAPAVVSQSRAALKEQYKDSSNFRKRTALHARFGANRYSFYRWVFDQIDFAHTESMLELGCGPGFFWQQNADRLPAARIVASDFSGGMVREARANLGAQASKLSFCQLDAGVLPFKDASFDSIVAMLMLYHVDDRPKAFAEIRRVLRGGGTLYASTMGRAHLRELREIAARVFGPTPRIAAAFERFGLETGYDQLRSAFSHVEVRRYESSMRVTEAQPVLDYFLSTARMRRLPSERMEALRAELDREITAQGGGIPVSTDLGVFVVRA